MVWIVGKPASGKTTLARSLVEVLRRHGLPVLWLDSDDLRSVLTPRATFDEADREAFYGALSHLGELCARGGVNAIISATASRSAYRASLRARAPRYAEIYLDCPADELARRDPKGLYAAARAGTVHHLPGVNAPFDVPEHADLVCDTSASDPPATLRTALTFLAERFGWPTET